MKTQVIEAQGFGGPMPMVMPAAGEEVEFIRDVNHGDWKTASVFPDRWPTIEAGTRCRVVGWMQNLYGVYVRVATPAAIRALKNGDTEPYGDAKS